MIVGYRLSIDDDDSHFLGDATFRPPRSAGFHDWRFGSAERPHPATCPTCGRKTDVDFINPTFRVRKRRQDVVATADGYCLASVRFRRFCEGQPWKGVAFLSLPSDPAFFVFRPTLVLPFDAARRATRFEAPCPACHAFYNVIGSTPVHLIGVERVPDGLFRTDLEFGSGHEQHPVLLTGAGSAEQLRGQRFAGLKLCSVAR